MLAALREAQRLSMLIVEQNLDLVLDVADRVVVLERGRIVREMRADGLRGGAFAELLGHGADARRRVRRRRRRGAGPPQLHVARRQRPARRRAVSTRGPPRAPSAPIAAHRIAPARASRASRHAHRPHHQGEPCRPSNARRVEQMQEIVDFAAHEHVARARSPNTSR